MPRVTITARHSGRFYVGLGPEDFAALYGMVTLANSTANTFGTAANPTSRAARKRVVDAFEKFIRKMKSETPSHDHAH